MPSDISENGFETIFTRYLVDHNGYEEGVNSDRQNARDESNRAAKEAIFKDVTSAME